MEDSLEGEGEGGRRNTFKLLEHTLDGAGAPAAWHGDVEDVLVLVLSCGSIGSGCWGDGGSYVSHCLSYEICVLVAIWFVLNASVVSRQCPLD